MLTVARALKQAAEAIAPHSDTPALDAQTLLAAITHKPRAWLLAHPNALLPPRQRFLHERACAALAQGVPLPYVLGRWEFYNRDFVVNPAVLIPRPETEILVERALNWLRAHPHRRRAADVGTGSGIIAITLAAEIPDLHCTATDTSPEALATAALNAQLHKVAARIHFLQTDLLADAEGRYDLIAANLPYIPSDRLKALKVARHEPLAALDGGKEGLRFIKHLLEQAKERLTPGGVILLEIDAEQAEKVLALARDHFPSATARVHPDLSGKPRVVEIQ